MRRCFLLMTAIAFLLLLSACASSGDFKGGKPVTKSDLESISVALSESAEDSEDPLPPYSDREPNTVYWTKSGSVYHKYRDCYYLKEADAVESGGVLTARMNGKERVCSECGDGQN